MRSNLSMTSSLPGLFGYPTLARDRRVKGVTLTRLPDLGRGRPAIRCHILVAMAHECCQFSLIYPGDQACQRQADSWRDSAEPASGVSHKLGPS